MGQAVQVQDDQELYGGVPQEPRPGHGHLRLEDHAPAPQGVTLRGARTAMSIARQLNRSDVTRNLCSLC